MNNNATNVTAPAKTKPSDGKPSANLRIAPALAPSTTVCAYDRAGHGRSDTVSAPQDGIALATDLHTLLERADVPGPYVLVGHSSGGPYVRVFAARYPDQIAGMVLLDAQPSDDFAKLPGYASFYTGFRKATGLAPSMARLGVLRFYVVYRSMVRAKVARSRLRQLQSPDAREQAQAECSRLFLAGEFS
jgi:pimeloyl-ACP methyl ester carboxylesterase